jgi:hypothetical protein
MSLLYPKFSSTSASLASSDYSVPFLFPSKINRLILFSFSATANPAGAGKP